MLYFSCWKLSRENKVLLFLSESCYLDNKVHLFIGTIMVYIIFVVRLESASFVAWSCHGITKFFFFFLRVVIWITRLLGVVMSK